MINQIEKTPRWFLVLLTAGLMTIGWTLVAALGRAAFADMREVRSIAVNAKLTSEQNTHSIEELVRAIEKISASQETYRKEYREDQTVMNAKLDRVLFKVSS